jgi:exopolysaccharide production protein ExoZ
MIYISRSYQNRLNPAITFFINRFQRIWPLYAFITFLLCIVNLLLFLKNGVVPFDFQLNRLASFLFIPSFNDKGLLQPILGVGWTLNYEMYFYLIFSISMIFTLKNLALIKSVLILCGYSSSFLYPEGSVIRTFFSNTIVFEFCLGMFIGTIYSKFELPNLNIFISLFIILLGTCSLVFVISNDLGGRLRFFYYGFGAVLVFIGFLLIPRHLKIPRFFVELGNASYSIYLIHIVLIYQVSLKVLKSIPSSISHYFIPDILMILISLTAISIGYFLYFFIEKPLIEYIKFKI